jgi:LCP family protein required for cell wall assembly
MLYSLRNFAITFLISLIIFGAVAWGIVGSLKNMSEDILTGKVVNTDNSDNNVPVDSLNNKNDGNTPEFKGDTFNFLAVGLDKKPLTEKQIENLKAKDETENLFSTMEAIMLVRADKENRKFVFMSLPTDFVINYKGENVPLGKLTKILNINDEKQLEQLLAEITSLTGLCIDYYAFIDMDTFSETIDNLGGISYTVPQNMDYTDEESGLKIKFKQNEKLTTGSDILKMLRFVTYNPVEKTENVNLDFEKARNESKRSALHMEFVNALFEKMLTVENIVSTPIWVPDLFKSTITNFGIDAVTENIDLIFSYKDYASVNFNYSQGYIDRVPSKYSDSEPNKELIKSAISRLSSEIGKLA